MQKLHSWKTLFSIAREQTDPQRKSMLVHSSLVPSSYASSSYLMTWDSYIT